MQPTQFKRHVDAIAEAMEKWRDKKVDAKQRQQVIDRLQSLIDLHHEQMVLANKLVQVCKHRKEHLLGMLDRAKKFRYVSPEKTKEDQSDDVSVLSETD